MKSGAKFVNTESLGKNSGGILTSLVLCEPRTGGVCPEWLWLPIDNGNGNDKELLI